MLQLNVWGGVPNMHWNRLNTEDFGWSRSWIYSNQKFGWTVERNVCATLRDRQDTHFQHFWLNIDHHNQKSKGVCWTNIRGHSQISNVIQLVDGLMIMTWHVMSYWAVVLEHKIQHATIKSQIEISPETLFKLYGIIQLS